MEDMWFYWENGHMVINWHAVLSTLCIALIGGAVFFLIAVIAFCA